MWYEHIPEWIVALGVLFGIFQQIRNSMKLTKTHDTLAQVQKQTNGIGRRLENIARKEGKAEGVAETEAKQ